jgi:hypothetical protein
MGQSVVQDDPRQIISENCHFSGFGANRFPGDWPSPLEAARNPSKVRTFRFVRPRTMRESSTFQWHSYSVIKLNLSVISPKHLRAMGASRSNLIPAQSSTSTKASDSRGPGYLLRIFRNLLRADTHLPASSSAQEHFRDPHFASTYGIPSSICWYIQVSHCLCIAQMWMTVPLILQIKHQGAPNNSL